MCGCMAASVTLVCAGFLLLPRRPWLWPPALLEAVYANAALYKQILPLHFMFCLQEFTAHDPQSIHCTYSRPKHFGGCSWVDLMHSQLKRYHTTIKAGQTGVQSCSPCYYNRQNYLCWDRQNGCHRPRTSTTVTRKTDTWKQCKVIKPR